MAGYGGTYLCGPRKTAHAQGFGESLNKTDSIPLKNKHFYRIFSDNQRIRKKVRKCLEMDKNKTQNTKTYGTCLEIVLRRKSKVSCMYIQRFLP